MPLAVWISPAPEQASRLRRVIEELASRYGGPRFEPHVTLASRFDTEARAFAFAERARGRIAGPLELERVTGERQCFRCLYLAPSWSGAPGTWDLDDLVAQDFEPHVSLFYGRLTEAQRRDAEARARELLPCALVPHAIEIWRLGVAPAGQLSAAAGGARSLCAGWRRCQRLELAV